MKLEIRLHLGAHKTATTLLQETLLRNHEKLANAGVLYVELQRLRKVFTRPLSKALRKSADVPLPSIVPKLRNAIRNELGRAAAGRKQHFETLVLSDEYIMGDLSSVAETGKLYDNRRNRLQLVRAIFQGCPTTVAFTIRNYNDFYPSVYAQLVKQGWSISYDDYLRRLDFENNTWLAIVADLTHVFGRDRIRLFRYEDCPANLQLLLESIVGRSMGLEFDAARIVYPSLNLKGIELLLAAKSILSKAEKKRLGMYVASEFVFDRDYGKPSIEDPALRNLLDRMYQRDETELAPYLATDKTRL